MRKGFGLTPTVRYNRSKFDLSHGVKTSFNVGDLVPLDFQEVLPGDTFSTKASAVCRVTSSFIKPVMDNAFLDIFHFFVPYRLIYDDAEKVFGNPSPSAYEDNDLAEVPSLPRGTVTSGTVGDYLGLPLGTVPVGASVLPFRAFALIYNQWFRNENTVDEVYINKGARGDNEVYNDNAWSPNNYFGKLPKVSKKKDYFTACLPNPQKGAPVMLPLGDKARIITDGERTSFGNVPLQFSIGNMSNPNNTSYNLAINTLGGIGVITGVDPSTSDVLTGASLIGSNLVADLQNATPLTVNDLRIAFQTQKMLEKDALYGSRYNEYLLGHFGVVSPDARLQFTEFLGGGRIPISVQQVAQTSQSTEDSPLANVSGYSLSNGYSKYSKGFVEHGYVFTVGCVRTMHTYQYGVPKAFQRRKREDFYDPLFANIGEQPVYRSEIYAKDELNLKDNVFGYNEAWADYRYAPSRVSGEMRSDVENSLDIWTYVDKYSSAPVLGKEFTEETSANFDRTVSVPSTSQDNFILDMWIDTKAVRVMPTYSIPGLIDHH